MEDCEGLKALSFGTLLEAGKEKEESLGLEEGNGEELERGREGIRVAEIEETAMELNTLCVTYSFSCVCSGLLEGGEEKASVFLTLLCSELSKMFFNFVLTIILYPCDVTLVLSRVG